MLLTALDIRLRLMRCCWLSGRNAVGYSLCSRCTEVQAKYRNLHFELVDINKMQTPTPTSRKVEYASPRLRQLL